MNTCIHPGDNLLDLVRGDSLDQLMIWHLTVAITAGCVSILMLARQTYMISKIKPIEFDKDDDIFFQRISGMYARVSTNESCVLWSVLWMRSYYMKGFVYKAQYSFKRFNAGRRMYEIPV